MPSLAAKPRAANSGPRSRSVHLQRPLLCTSTPRHQYHNHNHNHSQSLTITHNAMFHSRPDVAISLAPNAAPAPATTTTTTPPRSPSRTSTSPYPSKTHQPVFLPSSVPSSSRSQLARRPRRVFQYIRRIYHGRLSTAQLERHRRFTLFAHRVDCATKCRLCGSARHLGTGQAALQGAIMSGFVALLSGNCPVRKWQGNVIFYIQRVIK
jgi:hypothetical protein